MRVYGMARPQKWYGSVGHPSPTPTPRETSQNQISTSPSVLAASWNKSPPNSSSRRKNPSQNSVIVSSSTFAPNPRNIWTQHFVSKLCSKPKKSMPHKLTIFDLPVELHLMICRELDNVWDILALQETCKHFNIVLKENEAGISKSMSQSLSLVVPICCRPEYGRTLASIYPLSHYGRPGSDRPSYYWIAILQSRFEVFQGPISLNTIPPPFHSMRYLYRNWDCDITHLFWSWCELPSDQQAFEFLDTLDPRTCSRLCEFYFSAVSAFTELALKLPRPLRATPPAAAIAPVLEPTLVAPPLVAIIRQIPSPNAQVWDLLKESERQMGPPIASGAVYECTAALVGPFIIRDWAESKDFFAGNPMGPANMPQYWPSHDTAIGWLNTSARDCVRQTSKFHNRTNLLCLYFGTQRHQKPWIISKYSAELKELRAKMADPKMRYSERVWWPKDRDARDVEVYNPLHGSRWFMRPSRNF